MAIIHFSYPFMAVVILAIPASMEPVAKVIARKPLITSTKKATSIAPYSSPKL
jgi:hypothetical protein